MLLKSDILKIVEAQQSTFTTKEIGIERELLKSIPFEYFRLLIVSGVKNSGKSTLLFQLFKKKFTDVLYINFEHPRFYNLDSNDLFKLDEIIEEKASKTLFFDEIEKLKGWNSYVQQKLDEGFRVVITGTNAFILQNEVDSGFSGLNVSKELFPFSFNEYCTYNSIGKTGETAREYLKTGGFPQLAGVHSEEFLNRLFDDLLIREIAIKNGIRDLRSFKRLATHLLSNIGKRITGNQLKQFLGIKTTSTVMDYLSVLEAGYLFFYLPKFSYSVRKQMINPRKVYAIDTGLVTANSASFDDSTEQLLENMVFLHLRKQLPELYYFAEQFNCDFVVQKKNRVEQVIQVCAELKQDNLELELNGLFEAMEYFELQEGTIVTMNQTDRFERNGKVVQVVPFHEFV
jgi:predicted AAA+ superfamily ATPase